ncbi:chemoreceptor glutamine deamidase CheD [Alteromonas sp. ASW11-36]|uniref:Probable chemoreceptor glutamine deamidase CheD n=1 Tax=Alteromonas arenosi TaxID=3055817 RepID=A0ABT7T1D7_9ALTE|nr:chemoreceptor glutamine deamidase CheD [Alteromonas sp. ASW11-36]MDM7862185.1 chemoreceptor glutamine deamidase CheD [Alteromonas sp. ASW11-36]
MPNLHPTRYYDRHFQQEAIKILPGEFYATREKGIIVTVLGSCVSVCLRDPVANICGLNHFLLPSGTDEGIAHDLMSESARYGVYAMELLINELLKLGARKSQLEAKVFGGGNVLKGITMANIGQLNANFVLQYLRTEHIPIIAEDVLGDFPRKIYFFTETGEVKVRKIKSLNNTTIIDRESEYRMKIKQKPQSGDVDLF